MSKRFLKFGESILGACFIDYLYNYLGGGFKVLDFYPKALWGYVIPTWWFCLDCFSNISPRNQLRVNWWFLPKPPGSPNHQITISWKKEKSVWDFDPKIRSNFYLPRFTRHHLPEFFVLKNEATSTTLWYWDVTGCTQRQTPWPMPQLRAFICKEQKATVFGSGFFVGGTATSANLSYSRPNSCRISPATVPFWRYMQLMQHVIFWTQSRNDQKRLHLRDLNHMTFTSLSKDSLINIGIPQIGNGSSLAAYACIAENRGIPRADSRGKHYDEQGIIAMSLMNHVKVYQTKVGDLHFESVEHEDNLDLSNMIFWVVVSGRSAIFSQMQWRHFGAKIFKLIGSLWLLM